MSFAALVFVFSFNYARASVITPTEVISLVNQARTQDGLDVLEINKKLSEAAQGKADDMVKYGYFDHTSPQGVTPWDWFKKYNYDYTYAGENLAMGFWSAEGQENAWMNSASHRKNILNPNYQEVGVAVAQGMIDGKVTTIAIQEFGARPDFMPAVSKDAPVATPKTETVMGAENENRFESTNAFEFTNKPNTETGNNSENLLVKLFSNGKFMSAAAQGTMAVLLLVVLSDLAAAAYLFVSSAVIASGRKETAA